MNHADMPKLMCCVKMSFIIYFMHYIICGNETTIFVVVASSIRLHALICSVVSVPINLKESYRTLYIQLYRPFWKTTIKLSWHALG